MCSKSAGNDGVVAGLVFMTNTEKLVLQDLKWKEEKQINFQVVSEWKIKVHRVLKPSW